MIGPARFDLHVHSFRSPDGREPVGSLVGRAVAQGLSGFALTDHNTVAGHPELRDAAAGARDLLVIPGVEISAREGHVLAYGVSEAPASGLPLVEVLAWVESHGGEAVLAHPFRWPHGAGRGPLPVRGLSAVETINGHNRSHANARGQDLAARLSLPGTGGSDAHRLKDLGRATTIFEGSCTSVDDFLAILRKGRVRADGRSLAGSEWISWGLSSGWARVRRGLRPL